MERSELSELREPCEVCGLSPVIESARRASRIVAQDPSTADLLRRAARFAQTDAPIVILGESGSGKEVVARAIHQSSARRDRPFVAVNVAALPAELLESELFGHAKGSFTGATSAKRGLFEEADGGTLFLDEIAEMPAALQAKLLRALQDGEIRRVGETHTFGVDARIVCATHRDLSEHVRNGSFREDLFYRLKVLTLYVPPLRERRADIVPLAERFVEDEGRHVRFSPEAERALTEHAWPGNVRELANAVKHGLALVEGHVIGIEHLPEDIVVSAGEPVARAASAEAFRPLAEVEREHVLRVLEACGGSQLEAAKILGIGRTTLWRKLRSYP